MHELLEKLTARIEALERNHAATLLVLEAHDAVQVALTAKYEEQKAALTEAAGYAEESAREIRGFKDAVAELTNAKLELQERVFDLEQRGKAADRA